MPEQLFDRAAEYEAMLNHGTASSRENQEFFISGKSCGRLADAYLRARIVGADLSEEPLSRAKTSFDSNRVAFMNIGDL
jgi:hypothetical protein